MLDVPMLGMGTENTVTDGVDIVPVLMELQVRHFLKESSVKRSQWKFKQR